MNGERRLMMQAGASMAIAGLIARCSSVHAAVSNAVTPHENDGMHDFDFYFGRWKVHNKRLKERLVGSNDWEEFEATQECRPVIGGYGNIDDFVTDWNGGFVGMTLRLFNRQTQRWSLYWSSSRTGVLDLPVTGRFENGIGRFEGKDFHKDRPVLQRFIWSDITPDSARWEQALSVDEGKTWETNWRMHMTRIGH